MLEKKTLLDIIYSFYSAHCFVVKNLLSTENDRSYDKSKLMTYSIILKI